MSRHLELRDLATRQKQEKKQRELTAFKPRYIAPCDEHHQYTIPKPFTFHRSGNNNSYSNSYSNGNGNGNNNGNTPPRLYSNIMIPSNKHSQSQ